MRVAVSMGGMIERDAGLFFELCCLFYCDLPLAPYESS